MKKKEKCPYFQKGYCKNGRNCPLSHEKGKEENIPIQNKNKSNTDKNICKYFLENVCNRPKGECKYFHGFGDTLQHEETIQTHKNQIINLIKMDNEKYISSDNQGFTIRFIHENKKHDQPFNENEYKIGKMIYSLNNVIFILSKNTM